MSADQAAGAPGPPSPTPNPATRRSAEWRAAVLKIIGAIAVIFPIFWAAFTYDRQESQQRKQDFLQAYNLVHDNLGMQIEKSINDAIDPVNKSIDVEFSNARLRADTAATPGDKMAAIAIVQKWITGKILVKGSDPAHDHQIQNYQQALRNLIFLHQYAKADECTASVVLNRFREIAYSFWYYYPGTYNFDGSTVTTSPEPDPAYQLVDPIWFRAQQDHCTLKPPV